MEHNQLTFQALKAAVDHLRSIEPPKIIEHPLLAGMGNKIIKTEKGFLCSPEFVDKAVNNWDELSKEEISIIELPAEQPIDIRPTPDFLADQLKLWML